MLVLRRKVGEAVLLDGRIRVCILGIEGQRVKLGLEAPPEVVIVREELLGAQLFLTGEKSATCDSQKSAS